MVPTDKTAIFLPSSKQIPFPISISSKGFCQSIIVPVPLGYRIAIGFYNPNWAVYKIFRNSISFLGVKIIKFGMHLR
jgi:hypothetical protein